MNRISSHNILSSAIERPRMLLAATILALGSVACSGDRGEEIFRMDFDQDGNPTEQLMVEMYQDSQYHRDLESGMSDSEALNRYIDRRREAALEDVEKAYEEANNG